MTKLNNIINAICLSIGFMRLLSAINTNNTDAMIGWFVACVWILHTTVNEISNDN